ncbi:MAG TPA: UDP-3-O-(3-hydroxymyristoyl)glucosamine N-acyltransferase [Hyphomonadaceae bacterium]|nr:UDP-3-O-(3-hydroxymyristoyl)glucosamine N-acyltransferase [Hyphomonadaceae bacterium]
MIDPRFYEIGSPLKASEIAAISGASLVKGDPDRTVRSVSAAADAGKDDLSFLEDESGTAPGAGAVIATPAASKPLGGALVVLESKHARSAFARVAARLIRVRELEPGQAMVHPTARIAPSAVLEPGCVIGPGAALGPDVRIGANAVIGPGVQIGAGTRIGARASVRCALIGDGAVILPGAVIGETGFGLAAGPDGASLSPHFGRVIIQNGVSVGANSCIDRGLFADTVIGEGSQIDNLCHIGHNCQVGSHVVVAAFGGISGSSTVGDGVQFGGRVGLKDHVTVGPGARLAAGSAVLGDVPAGETWAGYPAKPVRTWMRELAWLARAAQKRPGKSE